MDIADKQRRYSQELADLYSKYRSQRKDIIERSEAEIEDLKKFL